MGTLEPFWLHRFWVFLVPTCMRGLTCGQQTNLKRLRRSSGWGGWGIILLRGREWQCRERQTVSEAFSTESSKRVRTKQWIKSSPHSVWQTITLLNVCNTTQHVSIVGPGSSETSVAPQKERLLFKGKIRNNFFFPSTEHNSTLLFCFCGRWREETIKQSVNALNFNQIWEKSLINIIHWEWKAEPVKYVCVSAVW